MLKLAHLLFLFIWIGSLLSLTRLLGFLTKEDNSALDRIAKICKKIYLFVDLPAMILAVCTGIYLLNFAKFGDSLGWFHMKLTFLILLIVCDVITGVQIRKINNLNPKPKTIKFKILHGMTALFLVGVLASIYVVRNKEAEIRTRIERELGKNLEKPV